MARGARSCPFVRELADTVVPDELDSSLFRSRSGTGTIELRAALRFLGLTDEGNRTTPELNTLVEAMRSGPDAFKAELRTLLPREYGAVIRGIDLQRGTSAQLATAFRDEAQLQGSANKKAVRFFLNAMSEAGFTLSPHFGKLRSSPPARKNGAQRKIKKVTANVQETNGGQADRKEGQAPEGMNKVTFTIPGPREIQVWLPEELSKGERAYLLTCLTGYFDLME
jgi:hypothetical protein